MEHWVVAQRHRRAAARVILGTHEPLCMPPFFWSNHFDLHIPYVGHGSGKEGARRLYSGNLKEKHASVTDRTGDKLAAVASVGRDLQILENMKWLSNAVKDSHTL